MKKPLIALTLTCSLLSTYALAESDVGVSVGTPAAINFVVKGDVNNIPLQFSGGYWGTYAKGLELGYQFVQNNDGSAFTSAQFLVGYNKVKDDHKHKDWSYVGVSATFSYKGFYVEPGLSIGSGDYSNPQLLVQAGYLWKF